MTNKIVKIYGIQSCDSCRSARGWMKQHELPFEFTDVRNEPLSREVLQVWASIVGWEKLVNKKSITWRKIPDIDRSDLNTERAIDLILNYPTAMKRPVLHFGKTVIVGFDTEEYQLALR